MVGAYSWLTANVQFRGARPGEQGANALHKEKPRHRRWRGPRQVGDLDELSNVVVVEIDHAGETDEEVAVETHGSVDITVNVSVTVEGELCKRGDVCSTRNEKSL